MYLTRLKKNNAFFFVASFFVLIFGLLSIYGIVISPPDYLQGSYSKIMYIHVPSAWLSLILFVLIVLFSALYLVSKNPVYDLVAKSIAPIGLIHNFSALLTGALWGKPTWGVYWVWDARLTSMFIQFCIYIIYMLLRNVNVNDYKASYSAAIFSVFGAVNIPIIKFSVYIWNTLHQKSSVITVSGPKIHFSMLWPLMSSFAFFAIFSTLVVLMQIRVSLDELRGKRL